MSEENEAVSTYEGKSYSCSQCGAQLMTFDETAITFCSYCGSQAMIESKMMSCIYLSQPLCDRQDLYSLTRD